MCFRTSAQPSKRRICGKDSKGIHTAWSVFLRDIIQMPTRDVEITGREADLILKYGYPFPDELEKFKTISGKSGWQTVEIDDYWLELIIGDLCRSMREVKSDSLLEELDALCDTLEMAVKG